MDNAISVFLSVGNPHKVEQERFLLKLEGFLKRRKICPLTLGRTNYSPISPLNPVKELMEKYYGAIILGFERTHCLIGYDYEGSEKQLEFTHRYISTPWNQIEAGMAFQIRL